MSDHETPQDQQEGAAPEETTPEAQPQQAPQPKQPQPGTTTSAGIAAAAASAGASLNPAGQRPAQLAQQQQQAQPQPQQPQAQQPPAPQQPAQPAQPQQPQSGDQTPQAWQPSAPDAGQAAGQAAAQPQQPAPQTMGTPAHHMGEMAVEGGEEVTLPDDGSAITFRREDRRAHSYLYVSLTFMVMMVMTLFAGDPSKPYLLIFPGWFVIVYFVMDAIEMETAKLRIDLRRIQHVRWKNALLIPMSRITDLDIWPKNSRTKTGLDIYYKSREKEYRHRIRIQDFRDFDVIIALIRQGVEKKAEFQLDDKQRRANAIFRSKNYDKLIIGVVGAIIISALHLQMMFGFAEYFRGIF